MRILKWVAIGVVALVAVLVGSVYAASEWMLARTFAAPAFLMRVETPGSADNGQRLSRIFGCNGCHGVSGNVMLDVPNVGRLVAPNIARMAANYSDAELGTLIRHGIKHDGTSVLVMPADSYSNIADDDLADVIAWVRALQVQADAVAAERSVGPFGRLGVIGGAFPLMASLPHEADPPVHHPTGAAEGPYLAKIMCLHCHRLNEEHQVKPGLVAPPVRPVTQGYDLAQFITLFRTGKGVGERELELMSEVVRSDFSHMSDEEITVLYNYLAADEAAPGDAAE